LSAILGLGAYLPSRVVTHVELAERLGVAPEWILSVCGIRERRYADPLESVVDLAEKASRACLEGMGMDPADLGGILVGTGTPHLQFPGVSSCLQGRLGAKGLAFDIHLASSGGLAALCMAADLTARYGPILVVGAECMSRVVERGHDPRTAILFGDGAGACVVGPGAEGPWILEDWRMDGDGAFVDALKLAPAEELVMDGMTVIMQANRKLAGSVRDLLERNALTVAQVDLFLFHQANRNLLRQVARSLGLEEGRVHVNVDRLGNTSAASVLIAAAEALGEAPAGTRAVLAAFGSGFSFGSMLARRSGMAPARPS
jgi:3-oxoacyl-[acyl-carrier-protein] synthase-3